MERITVPWKTYFFHLNKLNDRDREIYRSILRGLVNWEKEIPIPGAVDMDHVFPIFKRVCYECPFLFHISNRIWGKFGANPTIMPEYTMDRDRYDVLFVEVKKFLDNCTVQLKNRSDFDKLRIMHDAIRKHVVYTDTSSCNEHNILGAIIDRKAVCESIAKAYKMMCDVNRIPCICVVGRSFNVDDPPKIRDQDPDQVGTNHAWNMVRLDGKWYLVDVTHDLHRKKKDGSISFYYDYFLCSEARFSATHRPSRLVELPECSEDFSLYRKVDRYACSCEDIADIARAAVAKKSNEIVFELDPAFTYQEKLVVKTVECAAQQVNYTRMKYSYNRSMRVFRAELI